jgi:transmembrane sensor
MNMHTQRQIDSLQAQRASEWLEILKRGDPRDLAAFGDWCRRSPLHLQEFLEITCTDHALDRLEYADAQGREELTAYLRGISQVPLTLDQTVSATPARTRRSARWPRSMAAAAATLGVGLMLYLQPWSSGQHFSTRVGEQRVVELSDTSVVTLNTHSDIAVKFVADDRSIHLRHGEAVFKVAHDAARPFFVHTRAGTVQAIGTEFNVYDRPDGVDVTVLEGRVRLIPKNGGAGDFPPVELTAGENARIALNGDIRRADHPDLARIVAWSQRRLKFHEEPLEDMVFEFNRYHRDVQLRLEGIAPGSRHYSGIFDAGDPDTLARFLEREADLKVERAGSRIVIRPR